MPSIFRDEQRLAFGRVAELYDDARPSYPPPLIEQLIAFAGIEPGARVIEVGAGTGKATRMLAERGLAVLALEPDPAMAAVARRNCAGSELVEVRECAFEDWHPTARSRLLCSAQAWHWVDPAVRYVRAAQALEPGGCLAAIWTFPRWEDVKLRAALADAYGVAAPGLAPDFPMHPASAPEDLAGDWLEVIAASAAFTAAEIRTHDWVLDYGAAEYQALLRTHQDHILLDVDARERLLAAVGGTIEKAGGTLAMAFTTRLCLARRS